MAFDDTWFGAGTASVAQGSTAVTGQSANWQTAGIRQGDFFLAGGDIVPIAAVPSQNSITLTDGWPGANRSTASYKIIPAVDGARIVTSARDVIALLTNGNLSSVAALPTAANKLAYYTGAGAAALADLTSTGRALLGLAGATGAKLPVITAAGVAALRDIVGTVAQASGVPTAAIVERGSNANGEYTRWADGTQECWFGAVGSLDTTTASGGLFMSSSTVTWTFPAAFTGAPVVVPSCGLSTRWATSGVPGQSTVALRQYGTTNSSTTSAVSAHAVGRWF